MTTFVPAASPSGMLFLPDGMAGLAHEEVDPPAEWSEQEWLRLGDEVSELDADDMIRALGVATRVRARADALETRALARLHALRNGSRYVAEEAALELRVSRQVARRRVDRSVALVERLPRTLAAMADGAYEAYAASKIVDVTDNLSLAHAREVDVRLDEQVRGGCVAPCDATQLRRAARRLAQQVDPDGQAMRARRAREGRKVELVAGEDAMATLYLDLPAEVAGTAYARIDRDARALRNSGDQRTLDQLRADISAALLLGQAGTGPSPGVGAQVYLHMPIDTALTMSDDGAELSGYGPIPGPIARDIAMNPNSVWRKVLTDPGSGVARDISRRRRPTQAMRELIAARDRECPYCHRPARRCDFDHLTEWSTSGETSARNGGAKCEHHHYLKDEPGWRLDYDAESGTATITTPTGRTYTKKRGTLTTRRPRAAPNIAVPQPRHPAETPANSPPRDEPPC